MSRIIREIMYTTMSVPTMEKADIERIRIKMVSVSSSSTVSPMAVENTIRKGPAVIKIVDTLQSHLSAAVGKVDGQDMK